MNEKIAFENILKNKTPATQYNYKNSYNFLRKLVFVDEDDNKEIVDIDANFWLELLKDVKNNKNDKPISLSMRYAVYIMLFLLYKEYDDDENKQVIYDEIQKVKEDMRKERIQKNTNVVSTLPSAVELKMKLSSLFEKKEFESYIVNYLIINLSVRNADLVIKITDSLKKREDDETNYLILGKSYILLVRNNYKTSGTYGSKQNRITDNKFRTALINIYNKRLDDNHPTYLLLNDIDKPYSKENIGSKIQYLSIDKLGEGMINKIMIQDVASKPNALNKIKTISKNRGTSVENLIEYYNLDLKV